MHFCKIAKKEIPSKIITETKNSIAFLDAFPLSRGHTLVIPKYHYEKVQDMTDLDNTDLFNTVHKVISKVDRLTGFCNYFRWNFLFSNFTKNAIHVLI